MRIIKNTSKYESKSLRRIMCRVHAHMKKLERRSTPNWKSLNVKFSGRPRGGWAGWAFFYGNGYEWDVRFTLGLSSRYHMAEIDFAIAAYHELMHTYGYRHRQYADLPYSEAAMLFPHNRKIPLKG